ncbi:MAG TPA: hypothetical protein VFS43_35645 [Polyangiaceae bacterium]|nr:hypothetical protein [Polyangiaceae bacterium]
MRTTIWVCLLGFASVGAFVACGGDDDDAQNAPAGGAAGAAGAAGGMAGAGVGGSAGGAGGRAGSDGSLRLTLADLCRDRCSSFDALDCRREEPIAECDRRCADLPVGLSIDCMNALVAEYQCVKSLPPREAYECNAQGQAQVATTTRACQAASEAVITQCGRQQAGNGGAGGRR